MLFLLAGVALWLPPLRSSLWLDETGTFWTVKDGLASTFSRALEIQGQSPLYYLEALLAVKLGGSNELSLRLPSIVATAIAAFFVVRIGARLFDEQAGRLAALAFVCTSAVAFAAADARPYATALMLSVAATWMLLRWLDSGRATDQVLYVALAALTIYAHYLYAIGFAAHLAYAVARRGATRPSMRAQLWTPPFVVVACLPLLPQAAALWGRRENLSSAIQLRPSRLAVILAVPLAMAAGAVILRMLFAGRARLRNAFAGAALAVALAVFLVFSITRLSALESVPASVVVAGALAAAVLGLAFLRRHRSDAVETLVEHRAALTLLLPWAVLAPVVTYAISGIGGPRIFVPRYYVSAAPAVALLAAWMVRQAKPDYLRVALAASMLAGAGLSFTSSHFEEDWRGALRAADVAVDAPGEPVLIRTDFIEARSVEWLRDLRRNDWLLAPAGFYGLRGRAIPLPYGVSEPEARYVLEVEERYLDEAPAFVLVTNRIHTYQFLLEQRLAPRGWRVTGVGRFGAIRVTKFTRAA